MGAEAIGQSPYFGIETDRMPGIVLILEKDSDERYLKRLETIAERFNIKSMDRHPGTFGAFIASRTSAERNASSTSNKAAFLSSQSRSKPKTSLSLSSIKMCTSRTEFDFYIYAVFFLPLISEGLVFKEDLGKFILVL